MGDESNSNEERNSLPPPVKVREREQSSYRDRTATKKKPLRESERTGNRAPTPAGKKDE